MPPVIGHDYGETINAIDGVTGGADEIYGLGGNDSIYALGGNDMIKGGGGADFIDGGFGSDTVNYTDSASGVTINLASGLGGGGTAQGDVLFSVEGVVGSYYDDRLYGNGADNTLSGGMGHDVLKGAGGDDRLYGDVGNDFLEGGTGADRLHGGDGIDTASYGGSSAGVSVQLQSGVGQYGDAAGDDLDGIENLIGSAFDDTLMGSVATDNVLDGGDGNDTLRGMSGNDTLLGGDGDDELAGNAGDDVLIGGDGDDTYIIDNVGDSIIELAGEGIDTVEAVASYHLAAGAEIETMMVTLAYLGQVDLAGNDLGQTIIGHGGVNVLSGYGGSDTIEAHGGDDELRGGLGSDFLTGGAGNDAFIFAASEANGDVIVDFAGNGAAAGDILVFQGFGPGASFTQIDGSNWLLSYNGGVSQEVIAFQNGGANAIHASDFIFV